jgi:MFS family permease
MMDDAQDRGTGRLAVAAGVVAAASAASLATFFAVQGPFGTINDIGNAVTGILGACLALRLRDRLTGRVRDLTVAAAVAGATITVVGSALVVSRTTGFFLAALVSSVGFAGIGVWLVALSRSAGMAEVPRRMRRLGVIGGGLMSLGIATAPGIALRLDDMATAPAWVWIGQLGWLGTFVVYPVWAIWLGMTEIRRGERVGTREVSSWIGG